MANSALLLGYLLSPAHPGVGRSPGIVDLPVARDPLGYPMIPSSSIKGALKAYCAKKIDGKTCISDNGRINCEEDKCKICCCLFGPEPGKGEEGAGALVIVDFTLFAIPVPSYTHGWVYITSPYLIKRSMDILQISASFKKSIDDFYQLMKEMSKCSGFCQLNSSGKIRLPGLTTSINSINAKEELVNALKYIKELGNLANDIDKRILIVPDKYAPVIINKGLIKYTRVRLKLSVKTVETGALWTEEYLPSGTVFLGSIIAIDIRRNKYCSSIDGNNQLIDVLKQDIFEGDETVVFIGGKETIGKGLIKLKII